MTTAGDHLYDDMANARLLVGTAGWSIPAAHTAAFPREGSHLTRYAAILGAAEINSSFYRPHRRATYERWASSVPERFRFAVKLPKSVTHDQKLTDCEALLDRFLDEVHGLGTKLGALLIQLPPSLGFDPTTAERFLAALHQRTAAPVVIEPRNAGWFTPEAEALLVTNRVARVAADPALVLAAGEPGGWPGLVYWRLHGSPRMYYSDYDATHLLELASRLSAGRNVATWCMFDNTVAGHALGNALAISDLAVSGRPGD